MTKEDLIKFSSQGRQVVVDEPFNNPAHRNQIIFDAMRHSTSKKIFGLAYHNDEGLYLDLKCETGKIDELVANFPYILAGKHFTKQHWITLDIHQMTSKAELTNLVDASYRLTE
ncbi:MmcQ/YjbR family DNA-binding protein [Levilactobacillus paucivorans]|uniref:MmcQ/YjbR family DNA-binding protein n=1 Tax=Levilactobacillus paucivorans TaxID=616990 RepID=UPI001ED9A854|nr:MmcQ/YjbR family DNA-binding protein [Levilactobacillus paucivorans]